MKRAVLSVVSLCLLALAFPLASSAGWGGSPYEKSDCAYTRDARLLFCEATLEVRTVKTEQMGIPDSSCPSTLRLVRRTGTYVEPTRAWDVYEAPVPNANRRLDGDRSVLVGEEFWTDFTDLDLGCIV